MKQLAFIINPVSGRSNKKNLPALIDQHLDSSRFRFKIYYTERAGHATEIARDLSAKGVDRIVAVGGDGTVNEVARVLLFSASALGILPMGSGNGLARHLNIPMNTEKAIQLLNDDYEITMDAGMLNDIPFFCTAGIGFDAYIGKEFARMKNRGFQSYIKATLRGFLGYQPGTYKIAAPFGDIDTKAFLVTIGNTSQYGNNAFICPYADVQDGMLDVCIIRPFPAVYALDLGRRLFSKKIHRSRFATLFKAASVIIQREEAGPVHLDGEPMEMGKDIEFKIIPQSLHVIAGRL